MIENCDLSERRACRLAGLSRDSYRHPPEADQATIELSGKIIEIAQVRRSRKAKRPTSERVPLQIAKSVNEVWSMDF